VQIISELTQWAGRGLQGAVLVVEEE